MNYTWHEFKISELTRNIRNALTNLMRIQHNYFKNSKNSMALFVIRGFVMTTAFFCVVCMCILLTPNLISVASEHSNDYECDGSDTLLQQSIDMLQKWLAIQMTKVYGRVVNTEGNLHQKLMETQQANQYKFEVLNQVMSGIQKHIGDCKEAQEQLQDKQHLVTTYIANMRNMKEAILKLESLVELNNKSYTSQLHELQDSLVRLQEQVQMHTRLAEDARVAKDKVLSEMNIQTVKINQHEMVMGKLMDNAASWSQKINELQMSAQVNFEGLAKTVASTQAQLEDSKLVTKEQLVDYKQQCRRDVQAQRKKLIHQVSIINIKVSRSIEHLNETMQTYHAANQNGLDFLARTADVLKNELNSIRGSGLQLKEYKDKIFQELFAQRQELNKQSGVIKAVQEDVDVLVAFAGYKLPLPNKPTRHRNTKNSHPKPKK